MVWFSKETALQDPSPTGLQRGICAHFTWCWSMTVTMRARLFPFCLLTCSSSSPFLTQREHKGQFPAVNLKKANSQLTLQKGSEVMWRNKIQQVMQNTHFSSKLQGPLPGVLARSNSDTFAICCSNRVISVTLLGGQINKRQCGRLVTGESRKKQK